MRVETAKRLLAFVNQKNFEEYVEVYTKDRLEGLQKSLEAANTLEEIYRLQGQIKEIRRLTRLGDEVRGDSKKSS